MTGPGDGEPGNAFAGPRHQRPETGCRATPPSHSGP